MRKPRWVVFDKSLGVAWGTVRADNAVEAVAIVAKECGVTSGRYTSRTSDFFAVPTS